MSDGLYRWWRGNGGFVVILLVQAVFIIIWGVRLDSRVDTIEHRGSPQLELVQQRLTLFEERQNYVMTTLRNNSAKLDNISEELKKHEFDTRK